MIVLHPLPHDETIILFACIVGVFRGIPAGSAASKTAAQDQHTHTNSALETLMTEGYRLCATIIGRVAVEVEVRSVENRLCARARWRVECVECVGCVQFLKCLRPALRPALCECAQGPKWLVDARDRRVFPSGASARLKCSVRIAAGYAK